jgi:glyoxylase-like metal-dependent hydrolase (beta-lactamase superfamily II)
MAAPVAEAIGRMPRFLDAGGKLAGNVPPTRNVRYIINTSAVAEHVSGNAEFSSGANNAPVYAHENVLSRLTAEKVPFRGLPSLTFFGNRFPLSRWVNGEPVEIIHFPNAVTDGDSVVVFRRSAVVSTGEIFDITQYPRLDVSKGGTIEGLIVALNRTLELVIPNGANEGGTYVIGAHGRIGDQADLANYRNMVTIVRDRVVASMKKNMTLEQIQASRPTEDYDTRWGRNPQWTPAMFVEAIYSSLKASQGQPRRK